MATIDLMAKQTDFLQPLLEMMNKRMDTLEQKIDSNTQTTNQVLQQAKYTNGRVTKAEKAIVRLEKMGGKRVNLNLPPNIIYLLAIGFVILLIIIAKLLHADLGRLLT